MIVQSGSYVVCPSAVNIDLGWHRFKSILSGERILWLNVSSFGPVVLSSFGAIYPVAVNGNYIVETRHVVAFISGLEYTVSRFGGYKSLLFSGEGFVC